VEIVELLEAAGQSCDANVEKVPEL